MNMKMLYTTTSTVWRSENGGVVGFRVRMSSYRNEWSIAMNHPFFWA
jgi:hypothetical protein